MGRQPPEIPTVEAHDSRIRALHPRHHVEQRRLTGSVRPDQPGDCPLGSSDRHLGERGQASEANRDGFDFKWHWCLPLPTARRADRPGRWVPRRTTASAKKASRLSFDRRSGRPNAGRRDPRPVVDDVGRDGEQHQVDQNDDRHGPVAERPAQPERPGPHEHPHDQGQQPAAPEDGEIDRSDAAGDGPIGRGAHADTTEADQDQRQLGERGEEIGEERRPLVQAIHARCSVRRDPHDDHDQDDGESVEELEHSGRGAAELHAVDAATHPGQGGREGEHADE